MEQVKKLFKDEIFNEKDYQSTLAAITKVLRTADREAVSLVQYKEKWGFFIPEKHKIRLTLHSPGGQYNPSNGDIIMKAFEPEYRNSEEILKTILHETIHIGIEDIIIQKYNVPHWTKERIVDQFTSRQFKKALPNYWMQNIPDTSIDVIFSNPDVLDKLPQYVGDFMKGK